MSPVVVLIDRYRLRSDVLKTYLTNKFPDVGIDVQVSTQGTI